MDIISKIWEITTVWILFMSSYSLLFVIIAIRYIETHPIPSLIVLITVLFSNVFLIKSWKIFKKRSIRYFTIESTTNKTSDTLTYLIPYIIAFLGLQLTKWQDSLSFLILLGIVFIVYTSSNLILMNPILNIFGYKFYKGNASTGEEIIIITKKHLKASMQITPKRISKGLYLLEDS